LSRQTLNRLEILHFVNVNQRQGVARGTGTTGATDAVNVVFWHVGQFKIDHLWQLVNVQASSRNIRGHKNRKLA